MIEELIEQLKQLTTRLDRGEIQMKSLGVCIFRATALWNQFHDLLERREERCSATDSSTTHRNQCH